MALDSSGRDEHAAGAGIRCALREWVSQQTVDDLVRLLIDNGVPCAKVQSSGAAEHPHYKARQVHIEWEVECSAASRA